MTPATDRRAIVVAPHPDDEVLGASGIVTSRPCIVVFATDGVPPEAPDDALGDTRVAESRVAHEHLGSRVDGIVRLQLTDQRLVDAVGDVARALSSVMRDHEDADVYVPAYQRGHPDHDAVYVAALIARADVTSSKSGDSRGWFVYTLYGLDDDGRPRFDWLDPHTFPAVRAEFGAPEQLAVKAAALRDFASQLPDESVLAGWLADPVAEHRAHLPALTAPLPRVRCYYEEVFAFSQFGVDPERVTATLEAARAAAAGA
jgi:LmbE family N-acetylglucosaminyl deacetylase